MTKIFDSDTVVFRANWKLIFFGQEFVEMEM